MLGEPNELIDDLRIELRMPIGLNCLRSCLNIHEERISGFDIRGFIASGYKVHRFYIFVFNALLWYK